MLAPFLRIAPRQEIPHHFKIRSVNSLRNRVSVLISQIGIWALATETQKIWVGLVDHPTHCHTPRLPDDKVMGRLNGCLAMFVKSPFDAFGHDVVSGITGFAALDPIRQCFGVNARCAGGVGIGRDFS